MKSTITSTASKVAFGLTMLIAVSALSTTATATADECANIDRLARKIQRKTRLLVKKTVHYRHMNQYRALVRETSSLYGAATHIHEVAHNENNLHFLQSDLAQLDRCFHRLEALFDAAEIQASQGRGEIQGSTRQVKVLLDSIEDSIHQIQDDVLALQRRRRPVSRPAFVPSPQTYRPNVAGYRPNVTGYRSNFIGQRPVYSGYQPNNRQPSSGCGNGARGGARNGGLNFSFNGSNAWRPFGF